jgi:hypothetical protein
MLGILVCAGLSQAETLERIITREDDPFAINIFGDAYCYRPDLGIIYSVRDGDRTAKAASAWSQHRDKKRHSDLVVEFAPPDAGTR